MYIPPPKYGRTLQRTFGRSFSHAASSAFSRFSFSSLRATGSLILSSPSRMSLVTSLNAWATNTRCAGPAGFSSARVLAM